MLRREAVPNLGLRGNFRLRVGDLRRGDVCAPVHDMQGAGDIDPDVAVEPGAGIPAGGAILGLEADGDNVGFGGVGVRSEVECETGVTVGVAAEFVTVQPDGGV